MKRKSKAKGQTKKDFFSSWLSPLRVLILLVLTFGFSTVGRAAERVKRSIKSKKNGLKASYQALLNSKAWAYFRPSWHPDTQHEMTAPIASLDELLGDPENRIEKEFRVSSALKQRVSFWIDVYARFSSQYRILHDKDNPEIVYGYLDFRPLYRSMPKRMAHARAHQIEQRVVKELKERIAEAMEVSKPKEPTLAPEEKTEIRDLFAKFDIRTAADAVKPIRRVRAQTGQKDHFLHGIQRSQKLITEIEALFKERGLPVALARLPFVESSYNRAAVSKAGAIGMWQFLPEVSRRYDKTGTMRDFSDPIRQSRSAARMFQILRERFDDWGLAVTSYNSGAVRVKRIAEQHGAHDIGRLLKVPLGRGKLGFAGSNFFCEFLAAVFVEAYKDRIFTSTDLQLARIDLPRKVQSLMEDRLKPAPELKVVKAEAKPAKALKRGSKRGQRAKLKLVGARPKKKVRAQVAAVHRAPRVHRARSRA